MEKSVVHSPEQPLSLAVHLHLYYLDMWPDIKKYLQNIGDYPYDLFVTMNSVDTALVKKIRNFHQQCKIWVVENRGYDVGPFIDFLHKIDLKKYDLVMKIHTKNNKGPGIGRVNGRLIQRKYWYKLLIEALIGSTEMFKKNIKEFTKDQYLGMLGSKYCITACPKDSKAIKTDVLKILAEKFSINFVHNIIFVAGTMFMVRASLLQPIKDNYELEDFETTNGKIKEGTLAHILERIFGTLTEAKGYKIKGFDRCFSFMIESFLFKIFRFLYQRKVTHQGCLLIKICKIPVYHQKIIKGK